MQEIVGNDTVDIWKLFNWLFTGSYWPISDKLPRQHIRTTHRPFGKATEITQTLRNIPLRITYFITKLFMGSTSNTFMTQFFQFSSRSITSLSHCKVSHSTVSNPFQWRLWEVTHALRDNLNPLVVCLSPSLLPSILLWWQFTNFQYGLLDCVRKQKIRVLGLVSRLCSLADYSGLWKMWNTVGYPEQRGEIAKWG